MSICFFSFFRLLNYAEFFCFLLHLAYKSILSYLPYKQRQRRKHHSAYRRRVSDITHKCIGSVARFKKHPYPQYYHASGSTHEIYNGVAF